MAETMPPLIRRAEARGKSIGELAKTKLLLLKFGRKRLGQPSVVVLNLLEAINDVVRADQLCDKLDSVESWEELFAGE